MMMILLIQYFIISIYSTAYFVSTTYSESDCTGHVLSNKYQVLDYCYKFGSYSKYATYSSGKVNIYRCNRGCSDCKLPHTWEEHTIGCHGKKKKSVQYLSSINTRVIDAVQVRYPSEMNCKENSFVYVNVFSSYACFEDAQDDNNYYKFVCDSGIYYKRKFSSELSCNENSSPIGNYFNKGNYYTEETGRCGGVFKYFCGGKKFVFNPCINQTNKKWNSMTNTCESISDDDDDWMDDL